MLPRNLFLFQYLDTIQHLTFFFTFSIKIHSIFKRLAPYITNYIDNSPLISFAVFTNTNKILHNVRHLNSYGVSLVEIEYSICSIEYSTCSEIGLCAFFSNQLE